MPLPSTPPSGPVTLSQNARTVLEKRYLVKDDAGKATEKPEDLFWRVATVIAEWAGWWSAPSIVRAATGVLLGVAGAVVVVAAITYGECLPRAAAARPPHTPPPQTPT